MYVICMYVRPSFLLAYVKRTSTDVLSCATLYNVITMLSVTLFKVISKVLLNKAILSRFLNNSYLLLRGLCVVGKLGRGKKKARGGQWEGERSEEAAAFPSSHHPPHARCFYRLLLFLLEYPSGASAQKRGTAACAMGKRNVTPQKSKFVKYGIGWYSQKERDEKCPLTRNQPVTANWWEDI